MHHEITKLTGAATILFHGQFWKGYKHKKHTSKQKKKKKYLLLILV